MRKLSNFLKCTFFLFLLAGKCLAQCYVSNNYVIPSPFAVPEAKYGLYLPASGTLRVLVVFAEVDYGVVDNGTTGWPAEAPITNLHQQLILSAN